MSNLITGEAFIIVFDNGTLVNIIPTIYLTLPKPVPSPYFILVYQSVFHANAYIKANTLGDIKITIQAA